MVGDDVSFHHQRSGHVLVAVAAEDVAEEDEVPALVGVIVTRVSWSGTMSVRMPNSGILKPWMRSNEVSTKVSGTPDLGLHRVGRELELAGGDAHLGAGLGGEQARGSAGRAADQQRGEHSTLHGT